MSPEDSPSTERQVTSARIDVPLKTVHAYLFVERDRTEYADWWGQLFVHLQELAEKPFEWSFKPDQGKYVCRPNLSPAARNELGQFLKSAPAALVTEHRTLRRAVELPPDKIERLGVVFFSRDDAQK